ncbi:MAG TPA: non-homologous end-joining DNA ligase [Terriglobales bacterium]|nr:non-homologous end-joining DNA ligase [Terriglobales bacterium]
MPEPSATRDRHPAHYQRSRELSSTTDKIAIPTNQDDVVLDVGGRSVTLTNLRKPFWQEPLITKGRLLQYYADVSPYLLPHLRDRAMVMKRYPNGAEGDFFFMKRKPPNTPKWMDICSIEHASSNVIDFPVVQDLASLLWIINLGCIDLNQWYARCDDVDRPDVLHFDLDPFEGATWSNVCETALIVREALAALDMPAYAKTTGSRGIHVYVPIVRGPTQKEVWTVAKQFAMTMASYAPNLITAEYRIAKRPKQRVLLDYNQNAWGRTLASIYSVRPKPRAPVSTPVSWQEIESGIQIEDFRIDNVLKRLRKLGDLWEPLLSPQGRFDLRSMAAEKTPRRRRSAA